MALRALECLAGLALLVCAPGCKDKVKTGEASSELEKRCEQLAKACSPSDKKADKLLDECKAAAKQQAAKGCGAKVTAAYDCYEKEICGGTEKVWALDDFRVLTGRHNKCVAERDASHDCSEK